MKILVINSGSSSIKYQLFEMPSKEVICSGMIDRIGLKDSKITYHSAKDKFKEIIDIPNHQFGLERIASLILDDKLGVLQNSQEIDAVGHRVVHGGREYSDTTIIDQEIKKGIQDLFELAPLHNPPNLKGVEVSENIFPDAVQVAVFDTAFHQSIPETVYRYAIPNKFFEEHKIRLYGFHGTSHKFVSEKAIAHLKLELSKIVVIHLGNGCSITAVKNGKSIDHSLGFGPMNGLIMGTRSGDVDQAIIFFLIKTLGYSADEVSDILQKKGGMLGLTGYSDLREIESKAENGDKNCKLALQMSAYRIQKYIGAYATAMNGLDAIVFTAGIGENSALMRELVCSNLDFIGIEMDPDKNNLRRDGIREINTNKSKVKVLIIPTNEELEIAKQSYELLNNKDS